MTGVLSTAKRSYPTSEVRGRSQEDPMPKGRPPGGVTPRPRSGAAAESAMAQERLRSCPASEVRGGDERSYPKPLSPRPGAVAQRTNPMSKEPRLRGSGGPRGAIPL